MQSELSGLTPNTRVCFCGRTRKPTQPYGDWLIALVYVDRPEAILFCRSCGPSGIIYAVKQAAHKSRVNSVDAHLIREYVSVNALGNPHNRAEIG